MAKNASSKYVLYAIGEIALVVVGILIALQIDTWNTENQRDQIERKILEQLGTSLAEDLVVFEKSSNAVHRTFNRVSRLQVLLESGERTDSLSILCGAVYGILRYQFNTAAYEELKSRGFELISNDVMRQLVIKVYDNHLKAVEHRNNIEDNVILEAMRPYYLENFKKIRFLQSAEPRDENKIYEDDYYHNLVDYRLTVLRNLYLNPNGEILSDMKNLIEMIDVKLSST